jgi:hypothetical protein
MVQTIAPVVHGGRRLGYWTGVGLHAFGATATAAALGALLGMGGAVLGAPWGEVGLFAIAGVALVYAARELGGLPIPLPQLRRQVPEWWRTFFSPSVAALLYGLGLGVGFLTYLSFGTFVAVGTAALASGDPLVGAVVCAPFGLARGLSVLVGSRGAEVDVVVARLERLAATSLPRAVNAAVLAGVCGVALAAL